MATKSKTGLGDVDLEGADALFNTSRPVAKTKEPVEEKTPPKERQDKTSKPDKKAVEPKSKKTSVYLAEETIKALKYLKYTSESREGKQVSFGRYIDRAVAEMVENLKIKIPKKLG